MGGNNEFFENFERKKYLKKLPSMQRVKSICIFLIGEIEKFDLHMVTLTVSRIIDGGERTKEV